MFCPCPALAVPLTRAPFFPLDNCSHYSQVKFVLKLSCHVYVQYDLRVYALVTCLNPLRVYLYQEGLVRFASEPFTLHKSKLRYSSLQLVARQCMCVCALHRQIAAGHALYNCLPWVQLTSCATSCSEVKHLYCTRLFVSCMLVCCFKKHHFQPGLSTPGSMKQIFGPWERDAQKKRVVLKMVMF